jgi:hypothetical protein
MASVLRGGAQRVNLLGLVCHHADAEIIIFALSVYRMASTLPPVGRVIQSALQRMNRSAWGRVMGLHEAGSRAATRRQFATDAERSAVVREPRCDATTAPTNMTSAGTSKGFRSPKPNRIHQGPLKLMGISTGGCYNTMRKLQLQSRRGTRDIADSVSTHRGLGIRVHCLHVCDPRMGEGVGLCVRHEIRISRVVDVCRHLRGQCAERGDQRRGMARHDAGVCRRDGRGCGGDNCEILTANTTPVARLTQVPQRRPPYPHDVR